LAPDRPPAQEIDRQKIWRRSRGRRIAADLRPGSRKRGKLEGSVEGEKTEGGAGEEGFRSGRRFSFEEREVG